MAGGRRTAPLSLMGDIAMVATVCVRKRKNIEIEYIK